MPWYYAGPEAKPVGPLTLEELQSRRLDGTISPETHIIERTGQPGEVLAWKRYREVFPTGPSLPPPPPPVIPAFPLTPPPPPPAPAVPVNTPHPLFPSAAGTTRSSVFPSDMRPDPHYQQHKPTNPLCGWGFGLGLASFFLSFLCVGLLAAVPALCLCIAGLVQLNRRKDQSGHGLAVAGLVLSVVALLIAIILILSMAVPLIKEHALTVTEQTTNDSE
ncbi:MAG: DUF4190 domain-containing protein [Methylacidiphilales bacterium]|nr:DUF4190 domain-containing protein [Candidatus Methylacidiphilales bacterium]